MIPTISAVRMSGAAHRAELPLLVLGPSLGTSAEALWGDCAADLTDAFDVLAWDLPGHGHNRAVEPEGFTVAELAAGVLRTVDEVAHQRGSQAFFYAGDSVGGAVGLQLLLDAPDRVEGAVLLCTGAQIGSPAMWAGRIGQVALSGTAVMVPGSAQRWFGPGFVDREPDVASRLLRGLAEVSAEGYNQVCAALSDFDVRDRLGEIDSPVLAIAGQADEVTPPASLEAVAGGIPGAWLVELEGVAHLAPAEAPARVAALVREHLLGSPAAEPASVASLTDGRYAAGLGVRREVLGSAHVDRATAGTTDFTRDFQQLITEYAWGSVWARPGLDRRSRSLITLTAMVAGGHHDELAMHVRAALTNGLTVEEIGECLLQTAIYCGVPSANTAFKIAQQVLDELDESDDKTTHPDTPRTPA